MTRSNFFLSKDAQGLPHKVPKIWRRCAPPFLHYFRKTSGGVAPTPPPTWARVKRFKRAPSMPVPVQKRRGRPHLSAETVEKVRVFLRAFEDNKKLISTSEIAKALQVIKNNHCDGCSHQELAGPEVPGQIISCLTARTHGQRDALICHR